MPAHHESDDHVNTGAERVPDGDDLGHEDDVPLADRPDDDDHDLLTFGEAGARLIEEVAKQERRVARLERDGATDDAIAAAKERLEVLLTAQSRNRQPTHEELRESGFFGRRS
jgi:hypothetical protein